MGISRSPKVFAFGTENDSLAWQVADLLKGDFPGLDFIKSNNPDDIPVSKGIDNIIIMDAASGIKSPTILTIDDLAKRGAVTTHDIDLGFMLKLLKKANKIGEVRIIGLPKDSQPDKGLLEKVSRLLKSFQAECQADF